MITVKKGDVNQTVRILQYLLGIKADGSFWTQTDAAARKFQGDHGLAADGVVGPNTWGILATVQPRTELKSYGNAVRALQDALNIEVDGKYGPQTEAAVKALQRAGGLLDDGVVGPKTWAYLLTVYVLPIVAGVNPLQPVDFKQGDSRWGKAMYSSHGDKTQTIASSGCGPTSMADILATVRDPAITPKETCAMAVAYGYRTFDQGTSQEFFAWTATQYHFSKFFETHSTDEAVKAIQQGAYVVALMGYGYWHAKKTGGHYICLWKVDSGYIYANDPASSIRKRDTIADFKKESSAYFVFFN